MKEEPNTSKKFLQSYLYTKKFGNFFVSTCYRKSSAQLDPSWYYETFAWKLDKDKRRTDWIADNSGAEYPGAAFEQHIEIIRQLELNGKFKGENENV